MTVLQKKLTLAAGSLLASVIAACIGAEVVLRERWARTVASSPLQDTFAVRSNNRRLLWEYPPHGRSVRGTWEVVTNNFGFRDRDWTLDPQGRCRVAFVGDSVTMGFGVDAGESFVRLVEATLRGAAPALEVMNFGVNGYNTPQLSELLRSQVMRFSPSLVVYVMHPNDFDLENASGGKVYHFQRPVSFAWEWLVRTIGALSAARTARSSDYYHHHFELTRDVIFSEIAGMQKLLAGRGIPFRVVLLPSWNAPMMPSGQDGDAILTPGAAPPCCTDMTERVGRFLDAEGIPYVDLWAVWKSRLPSLAGLILDPFHPNARGHAKIAETVAEFIRADVVAAVRAPPAATRLPTAAAACERVAPEIGEAHGAGR